MTTICIVGSLLFETISFFGEVPVADFLFGTKWSPTFAGEQASFGVLPLLWGTLYLSLIALAVAVPLGLLSAIYLSEFAPPRVRKTIKPVLEVLAGVPTIVFGYFALTFFTPIDPAEALGIDVGVYNALSAGLIMGLLVLPTIASIAEDAMSAVPHVAARGRVRPRGEPHAGLAADRLPGGALGHRRRARARRLARRSARPCWCSSPAASRRTSGSTRRESYQTMAAFIASIARGDIPTGSIEYKTIFAVGFTLFVLTFILNLISIRLVRKYRQVYE